MSLICPRLLIRAFSLFLVGLGACALPSRADTHIYVGAVGTNQNDKLQFSNGVVYDATQTDYAFPQILRTNGFNAGYYRGEYWMITFAALAAKFPQGPIPGHAAVGSRIAVQVVSVQGPPGGSFAFWEGDGENDLRNITFSVPVGTTNGTNSWIISLNNGAPGTDPFGHIHGRELTCSAPGIYIVGFRAIDISTNGAGGGPIHSPSDILPVRIQAGLRIEQFQTFTNRVTVSFRSPPDIINVLEASESPASGIWQPVTAPLYGNNDLQTVTDTNAPVGNRFYRIHQLNNTP